VQSASIKESGADDLKPGVTSYNSPSRFAVPKTAAELNRNASGSRSLLTVASGERYATYISIFDRGQVSCGSGVIPK